MDNGSFQFHSRLHLIKLTGLKASNLEELLENLRTISGSSIYYHTHHFLQRHQHLSPEPPNDFGYWISESLGDDRLGEEISSIDTVSFTSIRGIREGVIEKIKKALVSRPRLKNLSAPEGEDFVFLKSLSFIFPTPFTANNLNEFADHLERNISLSCIYFHMFESRLRLERPTNDFSNWLANSLGEKELALKIAKLDPYTHTGESLRNIIVRLVRQRINQLGKNNAKAK
ncbi:MAG: hypothetical protein COV46_06445 [Deltaproteobacteria bacterium CG11_big_fil_rev_8_21_14_0_20_49_13]|nr:MAG: hypothetical protein COV46_06445 [Deltaproteobacteria bacterium CG11_big_fil_rev_8_21_14_0_20_49_13]